LQDDDSDEFEPIQVPDEDDIAPQGTHSAFKQPYRSAWRPDVSILNCWASSNKILEYHIKWQHIVFC
jgi:hypothetical protein